MKKVPVFIRIMAVILFLCALPLIFGGGYLISLSGSWYYLLAGIVLLISSVLLFKGRRSGVGLFFVLYVASVLWTLYESGSDYWGWVPRLSLLTVLGFLLSLAIPSLNGGRKKGLSRGLTGLFVVIFIAAFGMAFVPFHTYRSSAPPPDSPWPARIILRPSVSLTATGPITVGILMPRVFLR